MKVLRSGIRRQFYRMVVQNLGVGYLLMSCHLVLVRHGPTAYQHAGGLVDRDGLLGWRVAYDAAGIAPDQSPLSLTQLASQATHIIASDLPRAVMSAELLAPTRTIVKSDLLRETPLAVPHWPTRLPVGVWEGLVHLCWSYRILRGTDVIDSERSRATAAADWLSRVVADQSTALVVTHGVFRRVLATQLLARGWSGPERRGGYAYWSSWSFTLTPDALGRQYGSRSGSFHGKRSPCDQTLHDQTGEGEKGRE
jgi:broad specificity phosphatase PhoE